MPLTPPIISSRNVYSTPKSRAPAAAYHRTAISDPTPIVGALNRLRPQSRVSKLVNQFMNMSQVKSRNNNGGEEGLPGFLYHVPELPQGHSCKSMVDMFHAMTEWAKENPGPGKRPNLRASITRNEQSADDVRYPEGPEWYDVYHQNAQTAVSVEDHNGFHSNVPSQPKASLPSTSATTARHHSRTNVARKGRLTGDEDALIDFTDACGDDSAIQKHSGEVHPDLSLLRPLYPETTRPSSSNAQFSKHPGVLPKTKLSAASNGDHTFPIPELYHGKTAKKNLQVPNRVSSRTQNEKELPDKYLDLGLLPAGQGERVKTDVAADSVLPVKLRIARFEANAQATKRRPVRKTPHLNPTEETSIGQEAVPDIIRWLTPHKPVGPPLSKEQMAELCEPRALPQYVTHHQYRPYRPEYAREMGSMKDRRQEREGQPRLRRVESISFNSISQANAGGHSRALTKRSPNLPTLVPKVSHLPADRTMNVPNLPYLAAGTAFSKDEALQKLQHDPGQRKKTDCEKTQALAPRLTQDIATSPPTPVLCQNAQVRLYETLSSSSTSQPQVDSNIQNSFRRSLSRGTAARLLEIEPGFDFNAAFQDAKKSSIDPAFRQIPAAGIQQNRQFQHHQNMRLTGTKQDTILQPSHNTTNNANRLVREKVELFEAKTRESIINGDVNNNLGGNFAWPRFSDRQYVDPASEYAAKWREERKARRRGMVFDPKEVEKALQANQKIYT